MNNNQLIKIWCTSGAIRFNTVYRSVTHLRDMDTIIVLMLVHGIARCFCYNICPIDKGSETEVETGRKFVKLIPI